MKWSDSLMDSMEMKLSKTNEIVKVGEPGMLPALGLKRVEHDLAA